MSSPTPRVVGSLAAVIVAVAVAVAVAAVGAPAGAGAGDDDRFERARCPTPDEVAVIEERIDVGGTPAGGAGSIGSDYVYRGPTCVLVEHDDEAGGQLSDNFQPIRVTLFDPETGEVATEAYSVFASVRSPTLQDEQLYPFAYPYRDDPDREPGVYRGIVIVPFTGQWTVAVSAFDRVDFSESGIPTPLGRGTLEIDVVAPTLESALDTGRISDPSGANFFEVFVLGLHSAVGLSWLGFAFAAALLAVGSRRQWLSEGQNDALDRNVDRITQGVIWMTVLVWVTGVINLNQAAAYSIPLSPDQARDLFRLPYGKPYVLALYIKMAAYLIMTLLAVPLVRAARRAAAEWDGPLVVPGSEPSPETAVAGSPGPLAGTALMTRVSIAGLAVGGATIFVCVTALKYLHILSETVRGLL